MVGYCQAPATYKAVGVRWQSFVISECSYGAAQGACGYFLKTAPYTEGQKKAGALLRDRIVGKRHVGTGVGRPSQQRARLVTVGELAKRTQCDIPFNFARHLGLAGDSDRVFSCAYGRHAAPSHFGFPFGALVLARAVAPSSHDVRSIATRVMIHA